MFGKYTITVCRCGGRVYLGIVLNAVVAVSQVYITRWRIKEDALILCDSEFRA